MISNTHFPAFHSFGDYCSNERPFKKLDLHLGSNINYIYFLTYLENYGAGWNQATGKRYALQIPIRVKISF